MFRLGEGHHHVPTWGGVSTGGGHHHVLLSQCSQLAANVCSIFNKGLDLCRIPALYCTSEAACR